MVLKENQYCSTSVLTFLSSVSIPRIKLVYTTVSGLLAFLSISDINHNGIYSVSKDVKAIAVFFLLYAGEGNRSVSRVLIILGKAKSNR